MNFRNRKPEEDTREACQYGSACYRQSKEHLQRFKHPPKEKPQPNEKPLPKKIMANANLKQQKLNVFFTRDNKVTDRGKRKRLSSDEKSDADEPPCSAESSSASVAKETDAPAVNVNEVAVGSKKSPRSDDVLAKDCEDTIKKLFLVNMPDDFYSFWDFCKHVSSDNPLNALGAIDLQLVGPFDVLAGLMDDSVESAAALRHWRYFYDPPEFQTVIRSFRTDSFHVGYFRDEPDDLPVFVASNNATKSAMITPVAANLFGALDWCLKESEKTATPFKKVKSSNLKTELLNWSKKHNFTLDKSTENMRARDRKIVARTFHHAGIVVPYDKKTELGYRPLAETSSNLTKLLKQIDTSKSDDERKVFFGKLLDIVNWANIAMDEGDYGTCLELGLDLFSFGSHHLHKLILQLLTPAYNLLNRPAFAAIIKAHLENRKKGNALSVLMQ